MNFELNESSPAFRCICNTTSTFVIIVTILIVVSSIGIVQAQIIEDSVSIYKFVEAYQQTFNTHDPVAFAECFTEDADFLMFNLPEIRGRRSIENFWRDYWQSKFNMQEPERRGKFILNSVRFFSRDVALVNIESITRGQDSLGVEFQIRKARGTWLLHCQNGNWFISALCGMPTEKDSVVLGASIETAKTLRPYIRAFVNEYADAFNSHNPSAVSSFFRKDADIIVRNLPLIKGKESIKDWWRNYFSKSRPYKALFIIDEIRTISDDVVQVNFTVTGAFLKKESRLKPVRQTRAMWIIVRESGKWRIAALRVMPGKEDIIMRQ